MVMHALLHLSKQVEHARPCGLFKATLLAESFYEHVYDELRLSKTGAFCPSGNLLTRKSRRAFAWARDHHLPRFFTKSAVHKGLQRMLSKYSVVLPSWPGFNEETWLAETVLQLQILCKKSVQNSWTQQHRRKRKGSDLDLGAAMDPSALETQCWDASFWDEQEL